MHGNIFDQIKKEIEYSILFAPNGSLTLISILLPIGDPSQRFITLHIIDLLIINRTLILHLRGQSINLYPLNNLRICCHSHFSTINITQLPLI